MEITPQLNIKNTVAGEVTAWLNAHAGHETQYGFQEIDKVKVGIYDCKRCKQRLYLRATVIDLDEEEKKPQIITET